MLGIVADQPRLALAAWRSLACLLTGPFIGLCIGLLVSRLGIPSFVVTLAAFLGLQGVMLLLIGEGGTIADPQREDPRAHERRTCRSGWAGRSRSCSSRATRCVTFRRIAAPPKAGLTSEPMLLWVLKIGALAAIVIWRHRTT